MIFDITINQATYRVELQRTEARWQCRLDGLEIAADAILVQLNILSIIVDGSSYEIKREREAGQEFLTIGGVRYASEVRDPRSLRGRKRSAVEDAGPKKIIAPMSGKVVRVLVQENGEVESGQGIMVVEAMKMQNEIKSPKRGKIQKLIVAEGATVNSGDALAIVE
jgi:biotin carboxyl carrier protein